ncbi:exported hypothetical protein [Candidatus Sulfopaludibacter sp. SbA4]|nr:exported hypothetical protein [Candidatus Sulfopaludibacter sp. SbA4]
MRRPGALGRTQRVPRRAFSSGLLSPTGPRGYPGRPPMVRAASIGAITPLDGALHPDYTTAPEDPVFPHRVLRDRDPTVSPPAFRPCGLS